ncbi:hypothetical protein DNTS_008707 [Danionella cerebrum]|uniref:TNFR-Cys domain-containing protein n=1 Tax=Danionella cerebrum TaxID=2873325 RepID=A0A553MTG1_9TELE|nr:hypothetical protein DNTS_008707 [Danionella translucida]
MGEPEKCPRGSFMRSKPTGCEKCPQNTFIDEENNMTKCRDCRECSSYSNLETEQECRPDRNTLCKCKPGYYCEHPSDASNSNYTRIRDTVCKACPEGTYSDVQDDSSSCKNHTSCDDLGRFLRVPGTVESDVTCGDFKCTSGSWIAPASLWTGFVVTVLLVFLVCIFCRKKRPFGRTGYSLSPVSPVLPPDILKYPPQSDVEKCAGLTRLTLKDNYTLMDSSIQCDGHELVMPVSQKHIQSAARNGHADSIMQLSYCQSEPQESEWNDELPDS